MDQKKTKATFHAVSKAANVSPATVSRVVRGSGRVDPELAARVRAAAAALGIDLDRRKANTIAIVLSNRDFAHAIHTGVINGANAYCSSRGWDAIVMPLAYSSSTRSKDLRLPQVLAQPGIVRGAILVGAIFPNLLAALAPRGIPFSVFANNVVGEWESDQHDGVRFDGVEGAFEVTTYLLALGHRSIWHLTDSRYPWFAETTEGYRRAMEQAGLEPLICEMRAEEREVGYLGTKSIFARREPVTAIFAGSDQIAQGVYRALAEQGRRVPADISVAGCNDTEGSILTPALTTVRFFLEEMGAHLVELVLNRIEDGRIPPQHTCIPMRLVRRDSCGPPARGRAGESKELHLSGAMSS